MSAVFFRPPGSSSSCLPNPHQPGILIDPYSKAVLPTPHQAPLYGADFPGLPTTLVIGGIFARLARRLVPPSIVRKDLLQRKGGLEKRIADCLTKREKYGKINAALGNLLPVSELDAELQRLRTELKGVEGRLNRPAVVVPVPPAAPKIRPKVAVARDGVETERIEAAIGFTDFVNSTACKQCANSEQIHERNQTYFIAMEEVILKRGGRKIKEMGDAFLILVQGPDYVTCACEIGLELQETVQGINHRLRKEAKGKLIEIAKSSGFAALIQEVRNKSDNEFLKKLHSLNFEDRLAVLEEIESENPQLSSLIFGIDPLIFEMRVGFESGDDIVLKRRGDQEDVDANVADVAKRMEGLAEPGSVLLGPKMRDRAREMFEGDDKRVSPKGVGEVVVFRPKRKIPIWGLLPPQEELLEFRDRQGEMQTLQGAFPSGKKGGAVLVRGPAGIGKKRLVQEFLKGVSREHPATQVIIGKGEALSTQTPYHLIKQALWTFAQIDPGDSDLQKQMKVRGIVRRTFQNLDEEALDEPAGIIGLLMDVSFETLSQDIVNFLKSPQGRNRIFETVKRFLQGLAGRDPVILVLNNIHQADADSLQLVESALKDSRESPIMVLAMEESKTAGRSAPDWAHQIGAQIVELPLLDDESLGQMVDELFKDLGPEKRKFLIDESRGSPLLLAAIARQNKGKEEDHQWKVETDPSTRKMSLVSPDGKQKAPAQVREFLQARLQECSREEREILQMASVLCTTEFDFGVEELCKLMKSREDKIRSPLGDLVKMGFLIEARGTEGRYRFPDETSRQVVYGQITQVKKVHSSCAKFLFTTSATKENDPVELKRAYHLEKGGRAEEAVKIYMRRGASAKEGGSYGVAASLYEKAYELPEHLAIDVRVDALSEWCSCLIDGRYYRDLNDLEGKVEELKLLIPDSDFASRVKYHARKGSILSLSVSGSISSEEKKERKGMALIEFQRALELFDKYGQPPSRTKAEVQIALGTLHWGREEFSKAESFYNDAQRTAQDISDYEKWTSSLEGLSITCLGQGKLSQSIDFVRQAIEIEKRRRNFAGVVARICRLSDTIQVVGDFEEAIKLLDEGITISRTKLAGYQLGELCYLKGEAKRRLGELDEALQLSDEAGPLLQSSQYRFYATAHLLYRSLILRDRGDWKGAREVAGRVLDMAGNMDYASFFQSTARMILAQAFLEEGEIANALEMSERAVAGHHDNPEFDIEILLTRAQALHAKGCSQEALAKVLEVERLCEEKQKGLSNPQKEIFRRKRENIRITSLLNLLKGHAFFPKWLTDMILSIDQSLPTEGERGEFDFLFWRGKRTTGEPQQVTIGTTGEGQRIYGMETRYTTEGQEYGVIETTLGEIRRVVVPGTTYQDEYEYVGAVVDRRPSAVISELLSQELKTPSNEGQAVANDIVWIPKVITDQRGHMTLTIKFKISPKEGSNHWNGLIKDQFDFELKGRIFERDGVISIEMRSQLEESALQRGKLGNDTFGEIKLYFGKTPDGKTAIRMTMTRKFFTENAHVFLYSVMLALRGA